MKRDTMILMLVGIVSSVAAWGITKLIDREMDKRRQGQRNDSGDLFARFNRRNKILAGVGAGGVL